MEQTLNQNRNFIVQQMEENVNSTQKIKNLHEQAGKFKPNKNHFEPEESPERIQHEKIKFLCRNR